jgi:matrixin
MNSFPADRLAAMALLALASTVALQPTPAIAFNIHGPANSPASNAHSTQPPQAWTPILHWDLREFEGCQLPFAIGPGTAQVGSDSEFVVIRAAVASWNSVTPALINLTEKAPPAGGCPGRLDGHNLIGWNSAPNCALTGDDVWLIPAAACLDQVGINQEIIGPGPDGMLTTYPNSCGPGDDTYNLAGDRIRAGVNARVESLPNQLSAQVFGLTVLFADNATGRILEADVIMNEAATWHLTGHDSPLEGIPDVRTVALHELGHLLGIAHAAEGVPGNPPGPVMNGYLNVNGNSNHELANDDRDACNFLYCQDLGDAPDPYKGVQGEFPSIVRRGNGRILNGTQLKSRALGALHLFGIRPRQPGRNYTYEWLGKALGTDDVSPDCEARVVDADAYDDGLLLIPNPPLCGAPLLARNVVRYANDNVGNGHDYSTRPLCVNTWIDLDQNGVWSPAEKFVQRLLSPPPLAGPNATSTDLAEGIVILPRQQPKSNPWWIRTRLDWGENVGEGANVDGTLDQTKGAAQHGEVEDYPIQCRNPIRQQAPKRGGSQSAAQVATVVGGHSLANAVFVARVDDGDCVVQAVTDPPVTSYDPGADETRVDYPVSTLIPPGDRIHTGLHQLDDHSAGSTLRSFFVLPSSQVESAAGEEHIPTTHSALMVRNAGGDPAATLTVGVLPASVGGVIAEDLVTPGEWLDSMTVSVVVRVPAAFIPLDSLSLCNPALAGLPSFLVPAQTVTPSRPIQIPLPINFYGPIVVLEIRSTWSVNSHENIEILEFTDLEEGTVGVSPTHPSTRSGAALWSFPNPSPAGTAIRFVLPNRGSATLAVFDVRGALVRELRRDGDLDPGLHSAHWDGRDAQGRRVSPGTYFLVLTAGLERVASKTLQVR